MIEYEQTMNGYGRKSESMVNLHDLGGLKTANGRRIVSGALLRACQWDDTPETAERYHVARRLDLRSPMERGRMPAPVIAGTEYLALCGEVASMRRLSPMLPGLILRRGMPGDEMTARYAGFPETHREPMRRFFEMLLEEKKPTLYFCCQGKDRTGVYTAVILQALGVPKEAIRRDYLLANGRLEEMNRCDYARMGEGMTALEREILWSYMIADERYLDAFLRAQGGFETFWSERLGFGRSEREALQKMYTE